MTPAAILRLMDYRPLSTALRLRCGPEDRVCLEFTANLRAATIEGRLRAVWTHPANELATKGPKAALARALGLITGTADYLFLWEGGCAALEAKAPGAYPSPIQRDFRDWCRINGVPWFVFRSAEEGEEILRDLGAWNS